MPEPIKLEYASNKSTATPRVSPARVGWFAALLYVAVFVLLGSVSGQSKDDWAMNLQFGMLIAVPIIGVGILVWGVVLKRKNSRRAKLGSTLLSVLLLALLWSIALPTYRNLVAEIRMIRQMTRRFITLGYVGNPSGPNEPSDEPQLDQPPTVDP